MKKTIPIALALVAPIAATFAWQQPAMPGSSAIAAKIDFAKARSLPATSAAIDFLLSRVPALRAESSILEKASGSSPKDKADVAYAFSDGFAVEGDSISLNDSSALICGPADTDAIASAIKSAPGAKRAMAGKLEVATADFAKGFWFAFPEKGCVMVSSSAAAMAKAIATRDGRNKSLQAGSFLHGAMATDAPAVAAVDASNGAQNLSLFGNGMIRADARTILAKVVETNPGSACLEMTLTFADAKTAAQAYASINGLKLLASFQMAKNPSKTPAFVQRLVESQVFLSGEVITVTVWATAADIESIM